jgi:hypothetical protein
VTVLKKLSKYKLDLVGVQEVRWEGSCHKTSRRIDNFVMEKRMRIMNRFFFFII